MLHLIHGVGVTETLSDKDEDKTDNEQIIIVLFIHCKWVMMGEYLTLELRATDVDKSLP